jgi:hypothetical protein
LAFQFFCAVVQLLVEHRVCFNGFLPPTTQLLFENERTSNLGFNGAYPFEMIQTVSEVPEAPMLPLLILGAMGIALMSRRTLR